MGNKWASIQQQIVQIQTTAMADIAAAQRGGNEVHLGKTKSDMTSQQNPPRDFSQELREYHSANSSRDILQATGGDEGGEGGRNV